MVKRRDPNEQLELDRSSRRRAEAEAKSADAAARAADAAARRRLSEAEAARIESESRRHEAEQRARIEHEAQRRSPLNQARQLGLNLGGAAVGLTIAHRMSKAIDRRHRASVEKANAALKGAAAEARSVMRTDPKFRAGGATAMATLKGAVRAADRARLLRPRGPLALAKVALLASEAVLARGYFERKAESDTERDVWKGLGNAATFAAGGLLGDRLISRATPQILPNGRDATTIEKARALIKAPPSPVAPRPRAMASVATSAATRNTTAILRSSLNAAARSGGRVAALAMLVTGAATLATRVLSSKAEAAPVTTWTDRNGKVYHRSPDAMAKLKGR